MLICGPFHSTSNPPVGSVYLRSYLEERGVACPVRDLNIASRAYLFDVTRDKRLVDGLFSQSSRTYLAEAMAWSWHDPAGAAGVVARVQDHPSDLLRAFWRDAGIARLTDDGVMARASGLLRSWLLERVQEIAVEAQGWVGFSTTITNLPANMFMARQLKEAAPDLLVVIGGPEVTRRNARELLETFSYVDAAIPAPAYDPLFNLVSDPQSFYTDALPKGVWKRTRSGEIAFDDTCCEVPLDTLPPANWLGVDLDAYQPGFILRDTGDVSRWYPTLPLHTSQGCSYNRCSFCYNVALYPHFDVQSPERVVAEIGHQVENVGGASFFFTDFEFNACPERVKKICSLIRALDYEIRFCAWLRLDKLDTELLNAMYEAGARQIFVGVEAVDDTLLRLMNKGYDADTALNKLQTLHDFWEQFPDFHFEFNLITGYPGETLAAVRNTLAQVAEYPHLFIKKVSAVVEFMLHEGTPIFEAWPSSAVGCTEPLFPPLASLRSYRYLFADPDGSTLGARREMWSAIRALVQRDA
jgi:hypothetical protein